MALVALWLFRGGPPVELSVPPGQSAGEVARLLRRNGVIGSVAAFKACAKLTRWDRGIKPGTYRLMRSMSEPRALWRLTHGRPEFVKIVIPEGFNARQIAERLETAGVVRAEELLSYVGANRLEGYLFPTTYHFSLNLKASDVAHRMHREFRDAVEPEFRGRPQGRLSPHQAVILASIVEREAVLPREKPMIAAVYLNRLSRRKPLEADPTVQYALGHWKKGLTLQDLRVDSPYNTYVFFGLPPGPICSPGLDSIRAVLEPARTDAIYFVADNTGGHSFNVAYEEHLKAKAKADRERRSQRPSR